MKNQLSFSILAFVLAFLAFTPLGVAAATGPPHLGIYANNTAFRTVGTPTSLPSGNGQPFDQLYRFVSAVPPGAPTTDQQYPLSDFAPGQPGFVGGRWHVNLVVGPDGNPIRGYDFTAHPITSLSQYETVKAAMGWTEISTTVYFECPLIPAS